MTSFKMWLKKGRRETRLPFLFLRRIREGEEDAVVDGDAAGENGGGGGASYTDGLGGTGNSGAGRLALQRTSVAGHDRDARDFGSTGTSCAEAGVANKDLAVTAIGRTS